MKINLLYTLSVPVFLTNSMLRKKVKKSSLCGDQRPESTIVSCRKNIPCSLCTLSCKDIEYFQVRNLCSSFEPYHLFVEPCQFSGSRSYLVLWRLFILYSTLYSWIVQFRRRPVYSAPCTVFSFLKCLNDSLSSQIKNIVWI